MLNGVKNFGSADGFSDALHDEKQNKSNSKVGLILKYILERAFGKKLQNYMVSWQRMLWNLQFNPQKKKKKQTEKERKIMYLGMYPIDL